MTTTTTTRKRHNDDEARRTLELLVERDTKLGTLEVLVCPPRYDGGPWGLTTFLAGKHITGTTPRALAKPRDQWTYGLHTDKLILALTTEEGERIIARLATLNADHDAAERAYQARRAAEAAAEASFIALRVQRRDLMAEYHGLVDEQQAAFERRWDDEDESGAFAAKAAVEAQIVAAAQAVAAFDAANPAVIAQIKAERDAKTARFLAID